MLLSNLIIYIDTFWILLSSFFISLRIYLPIAKVKQFLIVLNSIFLKEISKVR